MYRDNWQKEREELVSQREQQQRTAEFVPPVSEVPAATTFYVAQLEERLQNVGYAHGQELQRLRVSLLDLQYSTIYNYNLIILNFIKHLH